MLKSCLHQASPRDTLRVLSGADYEEDLHTLFGSLITPSPSLLNHSYHARIGPLRHHTLSGLLVPHARHGPLLILIGQAFTGESDEHEDMDRDKARDIRGHSPHHSRDAHHCQGRPYVFTPLRFWT